MHFNCILIYDTTRTHLLFHQRVLEPYKGYYNLIGGKIEPSEDGFAASYRELKAVGINKQMIVLHHLMDLSYYGDPCLMEVYAGVLNCDISLKENTHSLVWLAETDDFFAMDKFTGEGNIGHMIEMVKRNGLGTVQLEGSSSVPKEKMNSTMSQPLDSEEQLPSSSICIGVDGFRGGWLAVVYENEKITIKKFKSIGKIIAAYPDFTSLLIDIAVGLQSSKEQIRPKATARSIYKKQGARILTTPCRQAVYAKNIALAYVENERILGKQLSPATVVMMPKIREIDTFLQENPHYKNRILESHPDLCFARMSGDTPVSRKADFDGFEERLRILQMNLPAVKMKQVVSAAKKLRCNIDDITDVVCLTVTAVLHARNEGCTIPEYPIEDETGLLMQMVIPKAVMKVV